MTRSWHPPIVGAVDRRITDIARRQHGLVTRSQLAALGMSRHAVAHLVAAGRLTRLCDRVLVVAGIPITDDVLALCATLDVSGALSFASGAALWGAPGYKLLPAHVVRFRRGTTRPRNGRVVHQPRQLFEEQVTARKGIPVMRPTRVLFDLAAVEHPARVERTLDWMWSRRLVTVAALDRTLDQLAVKGRPGITVMRSLIDSRRGLPPVGSGLESRFITLVDRAGLPRFDRQVDLGGDGGWIGRVDFVARARMLVVEIDSEIHHSALSDSRHDLARRKALTDAGYMVRSLHEHDLFHGGQAVLEKLHRWHREAPPRRSSCQSAALDRHYGNRNRDA